jgi:hypothetical protein
MVIEDPPIWKCRRPLATIMIRSELKTGKLTIKAMREQVGGISREHTIRKFAKVIAHFMEQMDVDVENRTITVPPDMREFFAAMRRANGLAK